METLFIIAAVFFTGSWCTKEEGADQLLLWASIIAFGAAIYKLFAHG